MSLRIGDTAPDFEVETTEAHLRFHEWLGDKWGVNANGSVSNAK